MPERSLDELSREELLEELRARRAGWHPTMTDGDVERSPHHAASSRAARLCEDTPVALLMLDDKGVVQHANPCAAQLLGRRQAALVGKPFIVAAPMRDPAPFWRHLERCLRDGQPAAAEIDLIRGPESRRVELTSGPSTEPGTGHRIVATALVDIERHLHAQRESRRAHEQERRIRARLEAQGRAVAAIGEAQATMHRHGVGSVLEAIAEQARHLVDAEMAALGIGGAPGQPFDHWAESGVSEEVHAAIGRGPPPRVGVLDRVATGSVIRTPDVTRHPGFRGRLPAGHPPITSFLGVPIRHRDRPMGNLYVANKRAAAGFDEDDERSLSLLGEYAALVIASALATDAEIRERARLRAIIDQLPESVIIKDSTPTSSRTPRR